MIRCLLACFFLVGTAACAPRHTAVLQKNLVVLTLRAPEAVRVQFASSLDRFTVHRVIRNTQGHWVVTGLPNREFRYFYLVDGKVLLPECRYRVSDDFGSENCRYLP